MSETVMTKRFLRKCWSETRTRIDNMKPKSHIVFPGREYFNCKSTVQRLNDAYMGQREYKMQRNLLGIIVQRTK